MAKRFKGLTPPLMLGPHYNRHLFPIMFGLIVFECATTSVLNIPDSSMYVAGNIQISRGWLSWICLVGTIKNIPLDSPNCE